MPPSLPIHRAQAGGRPAGSSLRQSAPIAGQTAHSAQAIAEERVLSHTPVTLRYVRTAPVRIIGEATGKQYQFSGAWPIQPVDPRDMTSLLSTGYFSRA